MQVLYILVSLISTVSCHNWYRGPTHFVIDVHRPRPRFGPIVGGRTGVGRVIGGSIGFGPDVGGSVEGTVVGGSASVGTAVDQSIGFGPDFGGSVEGPVVSGSVDIGGTIGDEVGGFGSDVGGMDPDVRGMFPDAETGPGVGEMGPGGDGAARFADISVPVPGIVTDSGAVISSVDVGLNGQRSIEVAGSSGDILPHKGTQTYTGYVDKSGSTYTDGGYVHGSGSTYTDGGYVHGSGSTYTDAEYVDRSGSTYTDGGYVDGSGSTYTDGRYVVGGTNQDTGLYRIPTDRREGYVLEQNYIPSHSSNIHYDRYRVHTGGDYPPGLKHSFKSLSKPRWFEGAGKFLNFYRSLRKPRFPSKGFHFAQPHGGVPLY